VLRLVAMFGCYFRVSGEVVDCGRLMCVLRWLSKFTVAGVRCVNCGC